MNRPVITVIALAAVLLAAVVWYTYRPAPVPGGPDSAVGAAFAPEIPPGTLEELGTLEEFEQSLAPTTAPAPVQRADTVEPDAELPTDISDIWSMAADNIADRVNVNIDLALEGDVAAAYFLQKAYERCRHFPRDRSELEEQVQRMESRVRRSSDNGRSRRWSSSFGPGNMQISSAADVRPEMESWFGACQDVRALFSPELRGELDRLAGRGHVIARYLFATWPLETGDPAVAFEEQMLWGAKARDYSLDNLQAGEPLGMLAFAQSYQSALFTRFDREMTFGFAHAALNCGLPIENVERYVDSYMERADQTDKVTFLQRMEYALAVSASLNQYCRN